MKCERCGNIAKEQDCREFQGKIICEDCYMVGMPKFVILACVMYNILVLLQKTNESISTSLMLTIDGERR